jgi:hypothetical protein
VTEALLAHENFKFNARQLLFPQALGIVRAYLARRVVYNSSDPRELVLEVKGYEDEQDRAKYAAAARWCEAVSNWGQMGRWLFDHCGGPGSVKAVLARHAP